MGNPKPLRLDYYFRALKQFPIKPKPYENQENPITVDAIQQLIRGLW